MSRMEDALRRAQRDLKLPNSYSGPDRSALDRFAALHDESEEGERVVDTAGPDRHPSDDEAAPRSSDTVLAAGSAAETLLAIEPLRPGVSRSFEGKLVVGTVQPVAVEQYRRLAATLHHAQANQGIKVVMIASALAGEGKTLTAVNLALTLSESYGRRVLLIDADFRRPMLHEAFQVPNISGLTEGLASAADVKLNVIEISPRLSLLPAGRPNPDPMSGLTSDRMRRVIHEASERFDWVIVDTPPVGLLPDAHLLASMVNATVLVVQAGRAPSALIQKAVESVNRNRVIGVVLNCVDDSATSAGGDYGHYYYGSRYSRPAQEQPTQVV
jgi:capsular exopolysaccharide synthesis family protein